MSLSPRARIAFLAAILVPVAGAASRVAFRSAGAWLIVEDPLKPADAVVVLAGQATPPLRTLEAGVIFNAGWAGEVWITPGSWSRNSSSEPLQPVENPDYAISREALQAMGVPTRAIRLLDGPTRNTSQEIQAVARELRRRGGGRVIIVTSKSHTRRVQLTWQLLIGSQPAAIVRYTPYDPFEPYQWWRKERETRNVSHEWLGMVGTLALFPFVPWTG